MYRNVEKALRAQASAMVPAYSPELYKSKIPRRNSEVETKSRYVKLIPIFACVVVLVAVLPIAPNIIRNRKLPLVNNLTTTPANTTLQAVVTDKQQTETTQQGIGFIAPSSIIEPSAAATDPSMNITTNEIQPAAPVVTTTTPVTYLTPDWNNRAVYDQFNSISYNGSTYLTANDWASTSTTQAVESELLAEKTTRVDPNTGITYAITVRIHKLRNIDSRCAIGVAFDGHDGVYAYTSLDYQPRSLGEMLDAIDFKNTVRINEANYNGRNYVVSPDSVYGLLLSNRSLTSAGDVFYTPTVEISVDCPALGRFNYSITLSAEGYLETNLLGGTAGACCYYIGIDAVNAFIASL